MANNYCTLAEIKSAMADSGLASSSDYDTIIESTITRACRAIDRWTGRAAGAYAVTSTDETTRYYTGSGCDVQWVDEMAAEPSYVGNSQDGGVSSTNYVEYSTTDYYVEPPTATPYTRLVLDSINGNYHMWYKFPRSVKVTAAFGYSLSSAIPDDIVQAAIIQTVRWFKRGQQAYKDTGAIAELGQLVYTQAVDPEVGNILAHYRRLAI